MNRKAMSLVEAAVVQIGQRRGRGVLIPGNMILTAAHCISIDLDVLNANNGPIEHITTGSGDQLTVEAIVVEHINDIAVLASVDEQEASDEAEKFEAFCQKIKPVKMCLTRFEVLEPFPVHVLNANGKWVWAKARKCSEIAQGFAFEPDEWIEGGASGGPIVNDAGELVGVVTHVSRTVDGGETKGMWGWTPYPPLTLPLYLSKRALGENLPRWTQNLKSRRPVTV